MSDADIRFHFDPVCRPFAWMTGKWVRMVAARRDYIYETVSRKIFDSPGAAALTPATRGSRVGVVVGDGGDQRPM